MNTMLNYHDREFEVQMSGEGETIRKGLATLAVAAKRRGEDVPTFIKRLYENDAQAYQDLRAVLRDHPELSAMSSLLDSGEPESDHAQ